MVCVCHETVEWTHHMAAGLVLFGGKGRNPFPPLFPSHVLFIYLLLPLVVKFGCQVNVKKNLLSLLRSFIIFFYAREVISHRLKKIVEKTSIIILSVTLSFWFFSVSFALKIFPLCWLNKLVDFKLGCEKNNDDKDKNEIDSGDAYKVDIDNGITRIKACVMIRDGKKKK